MTSVSYPRTRYAINENRPSQCKRKKKERKKHRNIVGLQIVNVLFESYSVKLGLKVTNQLSLKRQNFKFSFHGLYLTGT